MCYQFNLKCQDVGKIHVSSIFFYDDPT